MTQKTIVRRVCDRHPEREGFEVPVRAGVHASTPDLCHECQEELLGAVSPFLVAASRDTAKPVRKRQVAPSRVVPGDVRRWGAANGIVVPQRGRISRELEDRYLAARG